MKLRTLPSVASFLAAAWPLTKTTLMASPVVMVERLAVMVVLSLPLPIRPALNGVPLRAARSSSISLLA